MSAYRRHRGAFKVDGDHFDDGFYRAYGFKRGYGRAHNGKVGGQGRRRLVRRREKSSGVVASTTDSCHRSPATNRHTTSKLVVAFCQLTCVVSSTILDSSQRQCSRFLDESGLFA
jgi:hypothetical protein